MRLNVGCGEHYADGWCNLDLHRGGPKPDVVGSAVTLPFPNGCASRVYLGHVLEHIVEVDLPVALSEVRRVMRPDARLMVVGPDVRLAEKHEPLVVDGVISGGRRWPGDEHRWVATGEATLGHVLKAGFDARLIPVGDVSDEWPIVAREPWQFAIAATRGDLA